MGWWTGLGGVVMGGGEEWTSRLGCGDSRL